MHDKKSDELQRAWDNLPKGARGETEQTLRHTPGGLRGWRELIDQAAEHLRVAAGTKRKVAVVGPASAGKSTLYSALIHPDEEPPKSAQLQAQPAKCNPPTPAFSLSSTPLVGKKFKVLLPA